MSLLQHPLPRAGTPEMPAVYGLSCQSELQSNNDTSRRTDCNENELNPSVVNVGKTGDLKSIYSAVDKHILESMLDAVQGYMLQSGPQEKVWLNGEEAKPVLPKEKQAANPSPQVSPKTENSLEDSMPAMVENNSPDVTSVDTQETRDKYKPSESMENGHEGDVINSEVVDAKLSHAVESLNIPTEKELRQESTKEEGNNSTPKPDKQVSFTGLDAVFSPPKATSSPTDSSRNESLNTKEIAENAKNSMGNSLDLNDITKAGLDYSPVSSKETASCEASESLGSISFDDENDQFMMYLNSIEQTALKFKLQVEQAKIDTLQILKKRLEQAYEGTPLEEIPAKVHEKLQETIAQIATEEVKKYESVLHVDQDELDNDECGILKQMRAELDSLAAENFRLSQELEACKRYEQEYHALQGKIEGMEDGLTTMKHDYATKNGESEFLGKRIEALEQEMVSMRVEYEEQIRELQNENIELQKECLELDNENRTLEDELKKIQVGLHEKTYEADAYESQLDDNLAEKITAAELEVLEMRINELERHNKGLKASSEADHAVVVCLEKKVEDLESSLSEAKSANSDLLTELHDNQRQQASDRAKLTSYREELEALKRENKVLKCSLESSENEVQYQKRKNEQVRTPALTSTSTRPHRSPGSLGNKREIWNEIRELETILKDVQKEKQTIERKYQAFRRDSVELNSTANSVNGSTLETTQPSDPGSTSSTLRETPRSSRKTASLLDRVNNLLDKSSLPNGARTDVLTSTPVSRVSATLSRDAGNTPSSEALSRTSMSLGRSPLNSRLSEEVTSVCC